MNSIRETNTSGNWTAFVFGAVFNVQGNIDRTFLFDYLLHAVIGGIIFLVFNGIGDLLSPLWAKHKEKIRVLSYIRKMKTGKRKTP